MPPESEAAIQGNIQLALSRGNTRLFRNNCGQVNVDGRVIRYGVGNPGGSDLIGIHTVTVTPEMVGRRLGLFVAMEIKRPRKSKTSEDQLKFLAQIEAMGGIAGRARSIPEAQALLP